jgi:hypothetical protein
MDEQNVDYHLREALSHLERALDKSVGIVMENAGAQKEIARKWEQFLGGFFGSVREKGRQSRMNLLGWISFPRLR